MGAASTAAASTAASAATSAAATSAALQRFQKSLDGVFPVETAIAKKTADVSKLSDITKLHYFVHLSAHSVFRVQRLQRAVLADGSRVEVNSM
jgi:hypothetical protein